LPRMDFIVRHPVFVTGWPVQFSIYKLNEAFTLVLRRLPSTNMM